MLSHQSLIFILSNATKFSEIYISIVFGNVIFWLTFTQYQHQSKLEQTDENQKQFI